MPSASTSFAPLALGYEVAANRKFMSLSTIYDSTAAKAGKAISLAYPNPNHRLNALKARRKFQP